MKQMHGQFESLIPLLMYHERLSAQAAMDCAVAMTFESCKRFNAAEKALYAYVDADSLPGVQAYVQACQDLLVSGLHWR